MAKKQDYSEFKVDLWLTNLNDAEIGILPATQHQAKSRQFTKDMDIIGQVREEKKRTGLVAYRKGLWKDNTGMKKRLVIKLFSQDTNWRGTLDLMMGRSLQLTHGADGFPVVAYSINLARHPQIIQLERSAFKWPLFPEKFSFFILKDDQPHFYRLRRKIVAMGSDYTLHDQNNKQVGYIDGKVITLGGKWIVRIDEEHADKHMKHVIQLFCTMLKFNDACRGHINGLASDMHHGKITPDIEAKERELYYNPRRTR